MSRAPDLLQPWRDALAQWEAMANQLGGDTLRSEGFAQGLHGATGAAAQGQQALHQAMTRWLAAMNMPSRAEFADLSARIAVIEAAVARIEVAVGTPGSGSASDRPAPRRTRAAPAPKVQVTTP